MLQKKPKSLFARKLTLGLKVLFVVESAAFVVSFGIWYKLNTDRDFRLAARRNFPSVLEGFYRVGEYLSGEDRVRTLDHSAWEQEGKI